MIFHSVFLISIPFELIKAFIIKKLKTLLLTNNVVVANVLGQRP